MIDPAALDRWLTRFPRLTIGLVGDLFLDRYLELVPDLREMSVETGLEAYQVGRVRNVPGALGTVLNNLAALQVGLLVPVTVIGDDGHGYDLLKAVRELPVDASHVLCDPDRLTPTYTKPLRPDAQGGMEELNRLDVRSREPLSDETTAELCRRIETVWNDSDGLIVLDQLFDSTQGVVNPPVVETLRALSRANPDKLLYVDSRAGLAAYDFGTLKGNRREITAAAGLAEEAPDAVERSIERIGERTQGVVYCTCGEQGIAVRTADGRRTTVPSPAVTGPIDICGAGDAATSGIVASRLAGASPVEAAAVGNLVASITIRQLGTTGVASPAQLRSRLAEVRASGS